VCRTAPHNRKGRRESLNLQLRCDPKKKYPKQSTRKQDRGAKVAHWIECTEENKGENRKNVNSDRIIAVTPTDGAMRSQFDKCKEIGEHYMVIL